MVDWKKIGKRTAIIVFTTFLVAMIIINAKSGSIDELTAFELIELFVAIPLAAVLYYWLIASKLESFKKNMESVSADLTSFYNKVESFEKRFQADEKNLMKEELHLRREVTALRKESIRIQKEIREMKGLVKQMHAKVKKFKK